LRIASQSWFYLAALLLVSQLAKSATVKVRPAEIQDVLANPGMGIQTFQRYNGDSLNPGVEWSEEGPTQVLTPPAEKPDFPVSSVAYCRWHWSVLEPTQGKVRWEIIDLALHEARRHRQRLAIRLMPYDPKHALPQWYRESGARRANSDSSKDGKMWQPDFSDPLYFKYWSALIAEAGKRYDGHPDLDSIDISTVGYWGRGLERLYARLRGATQADKCLPEGFSKNTFAHELRPTGRPGIRDSARYWLALRLCGRYASGMGPHVRFLPEADRKDRHAGRLEERAGLHGGVRCS
jgi:hypothetical protein